MVNCKTDKHRPGLNKQRHGRTHGSFRDLACLSEMHCSFGLGVLVKVLSERLYANVADPSRVVGGAPPVDDGDPRDPLWLYVYIAFLRYFLQPAAC